ncbi:hypothetical protein L9F63_013152 [Diploptera punctata]|uniref:Uncharacterized protein n=1 Tax=Diploptera punctata TaxID=6984 RepID=A0AAD8AAR5_DIPPU|nr:hypothetical protein L9F63_013152 [Diploptera punctata]
MECIGRNKSVLDPDGYVMKDGFHAHYIQIYADAHLHDLSEKAVDNCIPAANAKAKEIGPETMDGKTCNRALAYTVMCIRFMKIEANCPKEDVIDSVDCTKVRAYLKEWNKKTGLKYN